MAKAKDTAKILKDIEAQTRDIAQKIWFAGLGAYGRAYTEAATNAKKMNAGTTELFEDLVQRGTEIDSEMKSKIASNDTVAKATENVTKMTEAAMRVQREQREALEARMQRMRTVLGFGAKSEKATDIASKIDKLEDEIAELAAKGKAKVNKDVATRLARLSAEIDAIAKVNAPAKKRKTTARKATAKKTAAKITATKKTATKKAKATKPAAKRRTTKKA